MRVGFTGPHATLSSFKTSKELNGERSMTVYEYEAAEQFDEPLARRNLVDLPTERLIVGSSRLGAFAAEVSPEPTRVVDDTATIRACESALLEVAAAIHDEFKKVVGEVGPGGDGQR